MHVATFLLLVAIMGIAANGSVVISEIFPRGRVDQPEWIEIKNSSSKPIDLKNWKLSKGMDTAVIITSEHTVSAGDFLVLTRSHNLLQSKYPLLSKIVQPPRWLSLNNFNDTVSLLDHNNRLVDKVCYSSSWFTGWTIQSLERSDMSSPAVTASSWDLAQPPSPALPNRAMHVAAHNVSLKIGPVPFYPNGDGLDDFLAIKPEIPSGYSLTVRIIGFDGHELFRMPVHNEQLRWDGRCSNGRHAKAGPYYVIGEFVNSEGRRFYIRKMGLLWR